MKEFISKFSNLVENHITRFQSGGLVGGDLVKLRADWKKNPKIKGMMENYKQMLEAISNSDLNLRVSVVKSIRPNSTGNYDTSSDAPADYYVDIVQSYAPGLWKNPVTVPIEILEIVETGINLPPVPDSLKRPSVSTLPKDIESLDKDRKLAKKDTKMANADGPKGDGRDQAPKPTEDKRDQSGKLSKLKKESTEHMSDTEMLSEAYAEIVDEGRVGWNEFGGNARASRINAQDRRASGLPNRTIDRGTISTGKEAEKLSNSFDDSMSRMKLETSLKKAGIDPKQVEGIMSGIRKAAIMGTDTMPILQMAKDAMKQKGVSDEEINAIIPGVGGSAPTSAIPNIPE